MKEYYVYVNTDGLPFVAVTRKPALRLIGVAPTTKEAKQIMTDYLKDKKKR